MHDMTHANTQRHRPSRLGDALTTCLEHFVVQNGFAGGGLSLIQRLHHDDNTLQAAPWGEGGLGSILILIFVIIFILILNFVLIFILTLNFILVLISNFILIFILNYILIPILIFILNYIHIHVLILNFILILIFIFIFLEGGLPPEWAFQQNLESSLHLWVNMQQTSPSVCLLPTHAARAWKQAQVGALLGVDKGSFRFLEGGRGS